MKKHSIFFLTFLTLILTVVSCSQVAKKIAQENLSGDYEGTINFEFKASSLNVGLQDFSNQQRCVFKVYTTPNSSRLVYTMLKPEGGFYQPVFLSLSGIQLRSNASSFNIPNQKIDDPQNPYIIEGIPMFVDVDGNKVDGAVDDQSNLAFSFTGNMPIPVQGNIIEIPCIVTCNAKRK